MSRSLGDKIARKLGVIAEPDIQAIPWRKESDQFLILGTDGLWDVCENHEAANFVEKFRRDAMKNFSHMPKTSIVTAENSCVAQLL
jgi:serine/threonine protein phosphatase PrpC